MPGTGKQTNDDLWREYSPSCWTKRFSNRDEVISHHLAHVRDESEKAVSNLQHQLDVPYGESDRERLDIFGIDLPDNAPIVAFVHGGYWHELSREESRYFAKSFHEHSIKTVIIGYELCPKVTVRDIIAQIQSALKFVFNYAHNKRSRALYLIGHSAGAHLIAKFFSDKTFLSSMPNIEMLQGAFLVAGIYDLTDLIKTPENEYLKLTVEEAKALSPLYDNYFHMRDRKIQLFIIAAEHDSRTFVQQSRRLYDMLMESCEVQNVHFKIMDGKDHFDVMEVLSVKNNYLVKMLQEDLNRAL